MKTKETGINLTKLDINNCKEAIKMADFLKDVVSKFDGKVYNRRFADALNADRYMFRVDRNDYYLNVSYLPENIHVDCNSAREHISLLFVTNESGFTDGKRINKDVFLEDIDEHIDKLKDEILTLENDLKNIDKLFEQREELMQKIEEFNMSFSDITDNNFNLEIKARRY